MTAKKELVENKIILKKGRTEGLFALIRIIENLKIEQDHNVNIKAISFNGILSIENPSLKDRLWDIKTVLNHIGKTSLDSGTIQIRELGVTDNDNIFTQEYEISGEAKKHLLVKEYINNYSAANEILNINELEVDLLKYIKTSNINTSTNLESFEFSIDNQNHIKIAIVLRSLIEKPITNLKILKNIPEEFSDVTIIESTAGRAKLVDNQIIWKVDELKANTTIMLNVSATLLVNTVNNVRTGTIDVSYEADSSVELGIEKFEAYTNNSFYIDLIEKDEEPGSWEGKFVFENISEFNIDLFKVAIYAPEDDSKNFVDISLKNVPRLLSGANWISKPWIYENDEYPSFKKKVEFRVVPDFQSILRGIIKISDIKLESKIEDLLRDWTKKGDEYKQNQQYYDAILCYERAFELDPNLQGKNIPKLSGFISGNFPIPVWKIYNHLIENYNLELSEDEFDWLVEENFDGYSIGIDPIKNPEDWMNSKVLVPWNVIVFYVNQKIDGVPTSYPDRLYFKDIRNTLFFPDHSIVGFTKQKQLLRRMRYILEECNNRGYFSRYVQITEDSIEIPVLDEHNILFNLRNLSNVIQSNFENYWNSLSKRITLQFEDFLLEIKNSVNEPLIKLIQAHRDKLLPEILEIHNIDKDDWEYFSDTYEGWKKIWNKLKSSLKLRRIIVMVFKCPNSQCGKVFRFLYLQETTFSKISKILLKIAPWANKIINPEATIDIKLPIFEKSPEINLTNRKNALLPDEITFLYQTLIGIENKESKTLASTFIFDTESMSFKCNSCI